MSVHTASLKGLRSSNEDFHNIILGINDEDIRVNFYSVYDGHGGKYVSQFLSENLPQFFVTKNVKYPLDETYINNVYDKIQNVLFTKHEKHATECGSTCLVVCHFKQNGSDWLNIMNTGDSRCVICKDNIAIPLTKDHKPEWPDEFNRITLLGGKIRKDGSVYRINDLSVSRAFGDKESCEFVTHRPELFQYKLSNDKFMILACDGLWDVMNSQDAVNLVLKTCYDSNMKRTDLKDDGKNIAKLLASTAIKMGSGDNITCIVVFFD